ncbi:hypothetical protein D3C75_1192240 [compost metagenome]
MATAGKRGPAVAPGTDKAIQLLEHQRCGGLLKQQHQYAEAVAAWSVKGYAP